MPLKFQSCALLILFVGMSVGCQKFSKDFNSVQKVCGVERAPGVHYLQILGADGQRLSADDLMVQGDATLTPQACVAVMDQDEEREIFLRHRTRAEGLRLSSAALRGEPALLERQLRAYAYSPAMISCGDEQITRDATLPLFRAATGLSLDAYAWDFAADMQPHVRSAGSNLQVDIAHLADGRYTIQGSIQERYAPEQRQYDVFCTLVVDRTPPEFVNPAPRLVDEEVVLKPKESFPFQLTERSDDVSVLACEAEDLDSCAFVVLKEGRWIAPEQGRQTILVKALDRAGNESHVLRLRLRVYDQSKITAIQDEMQKVQQLVDAQEGRRARLLLATVDTAIAHLGTDEEREPLQPGLRNLRIAVKLSPEEQLFDSSQGRFVDWMTFKGQTVLLFQKEEQLIAWNTLGQNVHRWTLPAAKPVQAQSCMGESERRILLEVDQQIYTLHDDLRALPGAFSLSRLLPSGNCNFGKVKASAGAWTLVDFKQGTSQDYAVQNIWMLGNQILTLENGKYFVQGREQTALQDHTVEKIFADGRILALPPVGTEIRTFAWQAEALVPGVLAPRYKVLERASSAASESLLVYHVQDAQWYLYDQRSPHYFRSLTLAGAVSSEKLTLGRDLLVYDTSTTQALELKIFDARGTLLSSFSRQGYYAFKGLVGNQLLLETADAVVLVNPFPQTLIGQTRNTTSAIGGMQWGPQWDVQGQPTRFSRARLQTSTVEWMVEEFFHAGRSWVFTQTQVPTKALQKQIERPFVLWQEGAAALRRQKDILVIEGASERVLTLPESSDLLRLDKAAGRSDLLVVAKSGKVWQKSLNLPETEAVPFRDNVWGDCSEDRKSLVYLPFADHYMAIACQKIYEDGQVLPISETWDGTLLGLHVAPEGQKLLVYTTTSVYILERKAQAWSVSARVQANWGTDALTVARVQADGRLIAFTSKGGRVAMVSLDDGQRREFRLAPSRPLVVDDLSLHEGRLTLLGPEGLLSVP